MATDRLISAAVAYQGAFGDDSTDELLAPNYLGDEALEAAVRAGAPLTSSALAVQLGPAFVEWCS